MWPWEHVAVGYLALSLGRRTADRRPGERETLVLVVATQFPDLVDKPLGWVLRVLPGGTTLGHSLLFAIPLIGVVLYFTRQTSIHDEGEAVTVGYLSHLLGDMVYPLLLGGQLASAFLFWPIIPAAPTSADSAMVLVQQLFSAFSSYLAQPAGQFYLALEVGLILLAIVVWVVDGHPGTRWIDFRHSRS